MFQTFTLFDAKQAAELLERVRALDFAEGKRTASGVAAARKNNRQAQRSPARDDIALQVVNALQHHRHAAAWTLPRYYSVPIFNRAGEGEYYGGHVDLARMVGMHGWPMRTDISYTLFLAPPESYEGGALRIQLPYREVAVKLPAGSLVLYPSTLVHEVQPVTRGERYCVAGWIESMVHSATQRDLLYRLSVHCAKVAELHPGDDGLQNDMTALLQGFIKELAQ
jgi:PKHD-type hydroxylase